MARGIKGITVKIGGDTVGLEKSLRDVNKKSRDLQGELSQVQKMLKFNPRNTQLMAQQQRLLTDQVENTSKKLGQLKAAQAEVLVQFQRGEISAETYRSFQREMIATENSLKTAEKALADFKKEEENVQKSTKELDRLFEATGKSIDDFGDVLDEKLIRSIKNGTASSKDLRKAFDLIGKSALGADADIDKVRQSLNKLESGEASIKKVRKELGKIAKDAKEAGKEVEGLGGKIGELGGAVGGLAAGVGIGGIIEKSLETTTLDTTVDIAFNVPEESKQSIRDAIKGIETYGIEGESALEGVRRQWSLNLDQSDEYNQKIIQSAGAITRAFAEIDFSELIQESNEMASMLGMTQQEALAMTNTLLRAGFPSDQIDIISEFGSQLKLAGYNSLEIQGIFEAGIATKTWSIDNLLDGLQEGRILLSEFGLGVDETTAKLLEGTGISSEQLTLWGQAIAAGGEKGKLAMNEVALAVADIDNKTQQNAIGVAFFGTMWETQGTKITDTLINASAHMGNAEANQNRLNQSVASINSDPQTRFNKAIVDLNKEMVPLLTRVAEFITKIANWISQNPRLASTIAAITVALGIFVGILMALIPLVITVATVAGGMGVAIAAVAGPIGIAVGAIGGLIAIGVSLWKNWDLVKKKAGELWNGLKNNFNKIKDSVGDAMNKAKDKVTKIWGKTEDFLKKVNLKNIGKKAISGLADGIGSMANKVWDKAKSIAKGIGRKIKESLDISSPSRVTEKLGIQTGEGMLKGLQNTVGRIQKASGEIANASVPNIKNNQMNQPSHPSNALTVNLNSPKALSVREANREFNKSLSKMSLLW